MKKIDRLGLVTEKFDDIYEFIDTLESRPILPDFFQENNDPMSASSNHPETTTRKRGARKKFGTNSYAESIAIFKAGYKQGVRDIEAAGKIKANGGNSIVPRPSVVGFAPHVPNAIMGHPLSMIRADRKSKPVKELNIYYGVLSGWHATDKAKVEAARQLLDAINEIEKQGIRVSLHVLYAPVTDDANGCCATIKIKDAKQPLNLLKVSYPLVHSSFHRRQCWRYLEGNTNLSDSVRRTLASNYGNRLDGIYVSGLNTDCVDDRKKFLVDRGVMETGDVYLDFIFIESLYYEHSKRILEVIDRQSKQSLNGAKRAI